MVPPCFFGRPTTQGIEGEIMNCGKQVIESALFGLTFDGRMNLKEMRLKREKYAFQRPSRYLISGEEAGVENVKRVGDCLRAQLRSKTAQAELIIGGGKKVSIQIKVQARRPIENIEISFPFPEDMTMIRTEEMPVGDEVPIEISGFTVQSSFVDVGASVLMFGTRSKQLYFSSSKFIKTRHGMSLSWNWEPKAPFPTEYITPELYFDVFDSEEKAIEDYEKWIEKTFAVKQKENNPFLSHWLHDTRLILYIDFWLPVGDIAHTYQDAINLVKELRAMGVPPGTILVLSGWHWKYDGHFPEYWPPQELGGAKDFRALIELTLESGYHAMPHVNHHGFDPELPSFKEFSQYQSVDAYGNKRQHPEPGVQHPSFPIAYMDLAAEPMRKYLLDKLIKPVREFGIDALYLDQFSLTTNTPTHHLAGEIKLLEELRANTPGVLFGGEIVGHESTLGMAPLLLIENVSKVIHSFAEYRDGAIYETRLKTYLTKRWHFRHLKLASDYYYLCPMWHVIPAVPGKYSWLYYRYISEVGFERAFRASQDLADELGLIKTLRLNYREYGIDPLSRKEIEKIL